MGFWIVGQLVESGEELRDVWVDGRGRELGYMVWLWHDERTGCGSYGPEAESQCDDSGFEVEMRYNITKGRLKCTKIFSFMSFPHYMSSNLLFIPRVGKAHPMRSQRRRRARKVAENEKKSAGRTPEGGKKGYP